MSVKSGHRARLCGTAEVLEYFLEHPGATLAHAVDGLGVDPDRGFEAVQHLCRTGKLCALGTVRPKRFGESEMAVVAPPATLPKLKPARVPKLRPAPIGELVVLLRTSGTRIDCAGGLQAIEIHGRKT